jgi:ferric-chelate reductase
LERGLAVCLVVRSSLVPGARTERAGSAIPSNPSTTHSLTTPTPFMPLFARATTAATTPTTTAKMATHAVDAEALVFHVDILLCALLALPFLLNAPRLLARFSSGDQWRGWHILRYSSPSPSSSSQPVSNPFASAADSPVSTHSRAALVRRASERSRRTAPRYHPPAHVRSLAALFPTTANVLRHTVVPGTSLGQLGALVVYFVVLVYPTLYKSNPFTDFRRTGLVSLSQVPVVFALCVKNNPAGILLGIGYERVCPSFASAERKC